MKKIKDLLFIFTDSVLYLRNKELYENIKNAEKENEERKKCLKRSRIIDLGVEKNN